MKRGEIWQVELWGKAGIRPALVLTRDDVIPYLNKLTVAKFLLRKKATPPKSISIKKPI